MRDGVRVICFLLCSLLAPAAETEEGAVGESARAIPVAFDVDVVVVGGTSGGVAAAAAAAGRGARVFLAASRPYLGDDICAGCRLWVEPGTRPLTGLAARLFPKAPAPPTPMHIKRVLDLVLLEANVPFLYGCYVTDVLRDAEGELAGIVMANRNGRQAVRAKAIVDATPRATVARLAGARFKPYPPGAARFTRVVLGGELQTGQGVTGTRLPIPVPRDKQAAVPAVAYALTLPMTDGSFPSFAAAEQLARDRTWSTEQLDASESVFQIPPDPMKGARTLTGPWPGADEADLNAFRPAGVARLYVAGGCADLTREAAAALLEPPAYVVLGARIGAAAAEEAARVAAPHDVRVARQAVAPAGPAGDIREPLSGIRAGGQRPETVPSVARAVPVLGRYDVVVVGGGTSGAPAAIAAARHGAKTLVIEYLHGLGGVGTLGLIGKYYHGYRKGFTAEVDAGAGRSPWDIQHKMEWYRRQIRAAGGDIWFGALGCGAFVERQKVKGVTVATPAGRGVVLAGIVIDATGSADIAAAAGAPCVYTDGSHIAVQGTGLPPRQLGARYTNTDYTFVDETDVLDAWRAFVVGREKFKHAYDLGQLIDTRERRRIVGDFVLSPLDIFNGRTFPDTVVRTASNFDSHGYTVHPLFLIRGPDTKGRTAFLPYRCLLPRGFDGILTTGLAVSAHRDAIPVVRMQPDVQNQGYAAGVAAAMAARDNVGTRQIDVRALQRHLVEKGNLPESVLRDEDSYPAPREKLAAAVQRVANGYADLSVILAQPEESRPLLRAAYRNASAAADQLVYAHILGMLGDATGASRLIRAVRDAPWDKGWDYRGMGQFGPSLSPLDSLIIALGRTRDRSGLAPVLEKLGALTPKSAFSHCRAVAVALETLRDPAAAEPLARLLREPGLSGHAFVDIATARERTSGARNDTRTRNRALRELVLARALYRCGDHDQLGEHTLRQYAHDLRGHFARHALAVLAEDNRAE
ncbi:MAG: FAD-dependent oxidoreductase [Kiritimatiellae bacterium]|nr:FAD-dependent oxidoreductase [Kiritimatiellia bacterium]